MRTYFLVVAILFGALGLGGGDLLFAPAGAGTSLDLRFFERPFVPLNKRESSPLDLADSKVILVQSWTGPLICNITRPWKQVSSLKFAAAHGLCQAPGDLEGPRYFLKLWPKYEEMDPTFRREFKAFQTLREKEHPGVIRYFQVLKTENAVGFILEYFEGQELLDFIDSLIYKRLTLVQKYEVMKKILEAAQFLHDSGFAHRDYKLENILINPESLEIKIIDLDLSGRIRANGSRSGVNRRRSVGTLVSMPPEAIDGSWYSGPEYDVWQLGTLFYTFMLGTFPVQEETLRHLLNHQLLLKLTLSYTQFPSTRPRVFETDEQYRTFKALIGKMRNPDQVKRIQIQDALNEYFSSLPKG